MCLLCNALKSIWYPSYWLHWSFVQQAVAPTIDLRFSWKRPVFNLLALLGKKLEQSRAVEILLFIHMSCLLFSPLKPRFGQAPGVTVCGIWLSSCLPSSPAS